MSRSRCRRWLAAAGVLAAAVIALAAAPARANVVRATTDATVVGSGTNAAALVIDTGTIVKHVCVRFNEPNLSGIELLRRADVQAVFGGFGGLGAGVCALCGTGCPGDGSCLTCQQPNFWAYWRSAPGTNGFSYSNIGAGTTKVTNGAVEGWRWGTGQGPPPYAAFSQICEIVVVPTTKATPATTKLAATTRADTSTTPATSQPSASTTSSTEGATSTTGEPATTATSTAATSAGPSAASPSTSSASNKHANGAASPAGAIATGVAVAAVLSGLTVLALRRRARR